ncbi:hypothetical protein VNO78_34159 [Psophocarpus tetragonolobus]|uniref:Ferredoxin thioredoxin reductase alpha chain domain-containing protein n=1 Tax=Psophocarpus tetragonolobus TaxID=3891 RepID=A0AAN9RLU7_PSOTE
MSSSCALRLSWMSPNANCNCNSSSSMLMKKTVLVAVKSKSIVVRCEVANAVEDSTTSGQMKIGARVKVKVPLKVYHVPKVAEIDLTGMEGEIKQYVALWNGKRISANLPYKVQFLTDIPGRGPVKFFAHLKQDEFDYL